VDSTQAAAARQGGLEPAAQRLNPGGGVVEMLDRQFAPILRAPAQGGDGGVEGVLGQVHAEPKVFALLRAHQSYSEVLMNPSAFDLADAN
jgi:hypothetical protein